MQLISFYNGLPAVFRRSPGKSVKRKLKLHKKSDKHYFGCSVKKEFAFLREAKIEIML